MVNYSVGVCLVMCMVGAVRSASLEPATTCFVQHRAFHNDYAEKFFTRKEARAKIVDLHPSRLYKDTMIKLFQHQFALEFTGYILGSLGIFSQCAELEPLCMWREAMSFGEKPEPSPFTWTFEDAKRMRTELGGYFDEEYSALMQRFKQKCLINK